MDRCFLGACRPSRAPRAHWCIGAGRKKTCANDNLVMEMLMDLDDDAMALLAQLFRDRLLLVGVCSEDETLDDLANALDRLGAPQFAFRQRHQAHEVVYTLRSLVEKATGWEQHLFALDGYLRMANDYARHSTVLAVLGATGVPNILSAAWLRELGRCGSVFKLSELIVPKRVRRTRPLLHGNPAVCFFFSVDFDILTAH
eukprot:8132759-Pyramimonas_sp.AAC.1